MSPWMPPTYLWLAVEGLLGLDPWSADISVAPHLPGTWTWMAVKHLLFRGKAMTMLIHRGTLYSTVPVRSPLPVVVGEELVFDHDELFTVAFDLGREIIVFAASDEAWEGCLTFQSSGLAFEKELSIAAGGAVLLTFPAREGV